MSQWALPSQWDPTAKTQDTLCRGALARIKGWCILMIRLARVMDAAAPKEV